MNRALLSFSRQFDRRRSRAGHVSAGSAFSGLFAVWSRATLCRSQPVSPGVCAWPKQIALAYSAEACQAAAELKPSLSESRRLPLPSYANTWQGPPFRAASDDSCTVQAMATLDMTRLPSSKAQTAELKHGASRGSDVAVWGVGAADSACSGVRRICIVNWMSVRG